MQKQNNNNDLVRYAGMGAQIFASLGISVFIGYKADRWLAVPIPLLVWLLPFIVLIGMIYKLVKDTSKRKN
jgi:chromate transport protein ChrA